MSDNVYVYAGMCRACNRPYMGAVDSPSFANDVAQSVAEVIQRGDYVERVTLEDWKQRATEMYGCEVCRVPVKSDDGG